ncbi:MAG: outer membrane protein transport protein, partial [Sandaracinaceae bacterium]|nr:outer membrane protein transport protein [Sandaracinaceae bacterium]
MSLVLLAPPLARAGNDDGILIGNDGAMCGGAVSAVVHDGTATWYNPAGLASIDRNAVDVSASAFQVRAASEPGLISSTTGEENDGGYLELVSIPSAVTIARRIDSRVALALGLFAPQVSQHTTRTRLDAFAGANVARWTLTSAENRVTYHAGGGIGFRISDQLRIGVSFFAVYRELYDAFQTAGRFDLGNDSTRLLARGGITQVRSLGAEIGAGVQWEPHPGVIIALTARTPGLELITQVRTTSVTIDATISDRVPDDVSFLPTDGEAIAPGFAVLTPARFNLALGWRFSRGWITGELDVQHPLTFGDVVDRRLVWNVRVGARYDLDDRVGLGAGLFTDQSAAAPIAELGQTHVDFYGLTLGLEYRTPHRLGEGEGAQTLVFSTTVSLRYAYGVGQVGGLRFDPDAGTQRDTVSVPTD